MNKDPFKEYIRESGMRSSITLLYSYPDCGRFMCSVRVIPERRRRKDLSNQSRDLEKESTDSGSIRVESMQISIKGKRSFTSAAKYEKEKKECQRQ